jgi:predicted helicase
VPNSRLYLNQGAGFSRRHIRGWMPPAFRPGKKILPKASAKSDRTQLSKEIFWQFAKAGNTLANLHINYEKQAEYPLERIEKGQLNYRVEKMRLSKDKSTLTYNDFLTLKGIPPETYEYRVGNRSAPEWAVEISEAQQ